MSGQTSPASLVPRKQHRNLIPIPSYCPYLGRSGDQQRAKLAQVLSFALRGLVNNHHPRQEKQQLLLTLERTTSDPVCFPQSVRQLSHKQTEDYVVSGTEQIRFREHEDGFICNHSNSQSLTAPANLQGYFLPQTPNVGFYGLNLFFL